MKKFVQTDKNSRTQQTCMIVSDRDHTGTWVIHFFLFSTGKTNLTLYSYSKTQQTRMKNTKSN